MKFKKLYKSKLNDKYSNIVKDIAGEFAIGEVKPQYGFNASDMSVLDIECTPDAIDYCEAKAESKGYKKVDEYIDPKNGIHNDSFFTYISTKGEPIVLNIVWNFYQGYAFIDAGYIESEQADYFKNESFTNKADKAKALNTANEAFDADKVKKRIARHNEFDNGYVLHNYEKMTSAEAEEKARLASIENPDDIYYVSYDDIMNPSSDIKWKNGKKVNESLSPKKGDRVQMDYYTKINNGAKGTCTGKIGELCWVTWDDGSKSKEIQGFLKVINESIENLPIKDDLIYVRDFAIECKESGHPVENYAEFAAILRDDLVEPTRELYKEFLRVYNNHIVDESKHTKAYKHNIINEASYSGANNSDVIIKNLDNKDSDIAMPKPGVNTGISNAIIALINDEWEAIEGYNSFIATLAAENTLPEAIDIIKDIANEENLHIGQLQKLLQIISPNADSIATGEKEAENQIQEFNDESVEIDVTKEI